MKKLCVCARVCALACVFGQYQWAGSFEWTLVLRDGEFGHQGPRAWIGRPSHEGAGKWVKGSRTRVPQTLEIEGPRGKTELDPGPHLSEGALVGVDSLCASCPE